MSEHNRSAEIAQAALLLPSPDIRRVFLDAICGPTGELREQVEAQMVKVEAANTRIQPAWAVQVANATQIGTEHTQDTNPELAQKPGREEMGTVIGERYTLVSKLGTGGMGTVWLAEQIKPIQRRVAVKLIKPELVSNRVLARFDVERQALALMDHPNIAKVFDAGTTVNGRPFFVMELVEGSNLTDFCDALRLSIPQRIELFLQVCRAVQHAHQKGIIHRDLKPSNIIVSAPDGEPIPRVIDFGLAKAIGTGILSDAVKSSTLGRIVGTPLYMSPEQASGARSVDTRTDVYSLGILLYELLSGATPIEPKRFEASNNLQDIIRMVCDEEVQIPSNRSTISFQNVSIAKRRQTDPHQLKQSLQGELDLIIMKAIEKNPEDRYTGVAEFAAELERYLNQEPILALSGSRWYRLQKYTRRNRAVVLGGTAAVLALMIGLVGSTWGLVRANEQRDEAIESAENAVRHQHELEEHRMRDQKKLLETEDKLKAITADLVYLQKRFDELQKTKP